MAAYISKSGRAHRHRCCSCLACDLSLSRARRLGDLNYRVERPNDEVRRAIASGDFLGLLQADQLKNAQRALQAFNDFHEAPIAFAPTYKYDSGTSVYDTSEKARTPSWTDRVLWRQRGEGSVTSLVYTCSQSVTCSDHKPVSSLLLWAPEPNGEPLPSPSYSSSGRFSTGEGSPEGRLSIDSDRADGGVRTSSGSPGAEPHGSVEGLPPVVPAEAVDLLGAADAPPSVGGGPGGSGAGVGSLIDDLDALIGGTPPPPPLPTAAAPPPVAFSSDPVEFADASAAAAAAGAAAVAPVTDLSDLMGAVVFSEGAATMADEAPNGFVSSAFIEPPTASPPDVPLFPADDLFGSSASSASANFGNGTLPPAPQAALPPAFEGGFPPAAMGAPLMPTEPPSAGLAAGGGAPTVIPPAPAAVARPTTMHPDDAIAFDDLGIGDLLGTMGTKKK